MSRRRWRRYARPSPICPEFHPAGRAGAPGPRLLAGVWGGVAAALCLPVPAALGCPTVTRRILRRWLRSRHAFAQFSGRGAPVPPSTIIDGSRDTEMCRDRLWPVLREGVWAALICDELVLLDIDADAYFGLDVEMTQTLIALMNDGVDPCELTDCNSEAFETIVSLTRESLICMSSTSPHPGCRWYSVPREPGGLSVCAWRPYESLLLPSSRCRLSTKLEALAALTRCHISIALFRLQGVMNLLNIDTRHNRLRNVDRNELAELRDAVNQVRIWYPYQVDCLLGSAALTLMAICHQWPVQLVIGVQNYPFYAHA